MGHQYYWFLFTYILDETYTLAIAGVGTGGLEVGVNVRSTLGSQRDILYVHSNFYLCYFAKKVFGSILH
jgi:hypothetical protein